MHIRTHSPSRRDFLKTASAATLGALGAGFPRAVAAAEPALAPTADAVIVLWMGGGMAHTETFDPKRYTPFTPGLRPDEVLSTFPAIDTAVDHIKISAGLEHIAGVMDRATLIRTYTAGDLGFILHSRHQYHWHTGYAPPQTVAAPHIGSIVARTLGPREPAVPAFINIGQRFDVGEGEELKAFTTAGFLGSEYGPFNIPFPEQAADTVQPPPGVSRGRFESRDRIYRRLLEASPIGEHGSAYQKESLLRAYDNADRLLAPPPRRRSTSRTSRSSTCAATSRGTSRASAFVPSATASAPSTKHRWSGVSGSAACSRAASSRPARGSSR
jgi:hypothetical protein